jgi:hypothetical protein
MMIQWRDFLIGEIQDKLRKNHNFYEGNNDTYEMSPLKRIISRFEYILNTYLREFVDLSIKEWVNFIKLFTSPNLSQDELWKVNSFPFIVIHLSVKKKEKKKKDKKKKKDDKTGDVPAEEEKDESDDEDKNRVIYSPSLEDCQSHILNSMDMVIDASNSVNSLEADLMPFLQKKHQANFDIGKEDDQGAQWISEAIGHLNKMYDENIGGPNELLERFKKYDYILNVDKKKQISDLFKAVDEETNETYKKPLEDIKVQIEHYEQAHYEIMTLSEDEVDFRIFRVMAKEMKRDLGDQAMKHKERILDATYNYCTETVASVLKTYYEMKATIDHDPINEKELIASKDFNAKAPQKVVELTEVLDEVKRHYTMLEEFSYMYKEHDIESFWSMK